jgi:MSHA biogenesis protein MshQ
LVTPACGTFTYLSEPSVALGFPVVAGNVAGGTTANYDETLLGAAAVGGLAIHAENANSGVDIGSRVSGVASSFEDGVYAVSTSSAALACTVVVDGPFSATQLSVSLTGMLDGQTVSGVDTNPTGTGDCVAADDCNARGIGGAQDFRYGRVRVKPGFGPETQPLDMTLVVEYFDGADFATNLLDVCTPYAMADVALGAYTGGFRYCRLPRRSPRWRSLTL